MSVGRRRALVAATAAVGGLFVGVAAAPAAGAATCAQVAVYVSGDATRIGCVPTGAVCLDADPIILVAGTGAGVQACSDL